MYVYGKVTDDSVDLDQQIVDSDFARKALGAWFKEYANVRQMHSGSLPPAGVGIALDDKEDGQYVKAEVYEPGAVQQVKRGGYKAYSIGIAHPRIVRDAKAKNGRIVGGEVVEISLVDFPAHPGTKFALVAKAGGNPEAPMELLFKSVDVTKKKDQKIDVSPKKGDVHLHLGDGSSSNSDGTDGVGTPPTPAAVQGDDDDDAQGADEAKDDDQASNGRPPQAAMNPGFQSFYSNAPKQALAQCEKCGGKGMVGNVLCTKCKGAGMAGKKASPEWRVLARVRKGIKGRKSVLKRKDLKRAVEAAAHAEKRDRSAVRAYITDEARRLGASDRIPDQWKSKEASIFKKKKVVKLMQALHDLTCQVHNPEAVKTTFPLIAKAGLAASIGPNMERAILQSIQNEAVGGAGAPKLASLGIAYDALAEFLASEEAPDMIFTTQEELHNLFLDANKDILANSDFAIPHKADSNADFASAMGTIGESFADGGNASIGNGVMTSTPGMPSAEQARENIYPAKFRRAYIDAGHQREKGEGASAAEERPAANDPSNQITADDFDRGIGEVPPGQQRQSPANVKRAPLGLAQQIHDAIVVAFPAVGCMLEPDPGAAPLTAPSAPKVGDTEMVLGKSAEAAVDKQAAVGEKVSIKALKRKLEKKIRKQMLRKSRKATKQATNVADAEQVAPAPTTEPVSAGGAPKNTPPTPPKKKGKSSKKQGRSMKKKAKKAAKQTKQAAKKMQKRLRGVEEEIKALSAQPDPKFAPTRREPLHKGVTAEAQKRKVEDAARQQRAALEDQAIHSPDPIARDRAQQELMKLDGFTK